MAEAERGLLPSRVIWRMVQTGVNAITADVTILTDILREHMETDDEATKARAYWASNPPEVVAGYPRKATRMPVYAITLASDSVVQDYLGIGEEYGLDVLGEVEGTQFRRRMQATFSLFVYAEHPDICAWYYRVLRRVCSVGAQYLINNDLEDPKFDGMELAPAPEYEHEHLFVRRINLTVEYWETWTDQDALWVALNGADTQWPVGTATSYAVHHEDQPDGGVSPVDVGGGPAGVAVAPTPVVTPPTVVPPQATAIGYWGDLGISPDLTGQLVSVQDAGSGWTRLRFDAGGSGATTLPHQADRYYQIAVDTDGNPLEGQFLDYDILFGIEAEAAGGGPIPDGLQIGILLFNAQDNVTVGSSSEESFGVGLTTSGGAGLVSPVVFASRGSWNRTIPASSPVGSSAIRVAFGGTRPSVNNSGEIQNYMGAWAAGAESFSSPIAFMADYSVESNGVSNAEYTHLCLFASWTSAQPTDVIVDVRAWFKAIKLTSSDHGLPAQGFGS